MHTNYFKKLLIIAVVASSMIFGGCSGTSDREENATEETSETPTFEMPGESVQEAASMTTEETADESESETESETVETETDIDVVEVTIDTETEEATGVAADPSADTAFSSEGSSETEPASSSTNHIVVLDPGHGGMWLGAVDGSYQEKDLSLSVAFYCRDYLLEHYDGVTVYLTRETDTEFSTDQKQDLEERVRIASEYGAEILVSLHFNSDTTDLANGALVCVSKQAWVSAESAALGTSILNQLAALGINNMGLVYKDSTEYFDENGVAMDYYAICRHSASLGMVGIIVEHCFMRNAIDLQYYSSEEALMRLGVADAIGIAQYLGLTEK